MESETSTWAIEAEPHPPHWGCRGAAAHGSLAQRPGGNRHAPVRQTPCRRAHGRQRCPARGAHCPGRGELRRHPAGLHAPAACPAGAVLAPYARLRADARARLRAPRRRPRRRRRVPLGSRRFGRNHLPARPLRHRRGARLRPPHPELAGCRVRPRLSARPHLRLQRVVFCTCRVYARRSCCGRRRSSGTTLSDAYSNRPSIMPQKKNP